METGYACRACGRPVLVLARFRVWVCEHAGATIVASMRAVVTSPGRVSVRP